MDTDSLGWNLVFLTHFANSEKEAEGFKFMYPRSQSQHGDWEGHMASDVTGKVT